MKVLPGTLLSAGIMILAACNNSGSQQNQEQAKDSTAAPKTSIPDAKDFQKTIDGKATNLYTIKNNDIEVAITNYGARIVSLVVPDKKGNPTDVVVGQEKLEQYENGGDTYFGAIVGRYGNRIAKGKFKLDGKEYTLATNNGANHLHGGKTGFSRKVWDARQVNDSTLALTYTSNDGEEGYPGTLTAKVTYTATGNKSVKINYEISTDKKTVANLTNHSYFNLNGQGGGTINNHTLQLNADNFTPVDSTLIPVGKIVPVANTPLDFRKPTTIGARVNDTSDVQIKYGKGYDHNFVLNKNAGAGLNKAAEVIGDNSGIQMDVFTSEPGVQFYGGNFMQGTNYIKGKKKDDYRTAFCLETQHFPDSPNQPSFPTTTLVPGKKYTSTTEYVFSIGK